MLFSNGDNFILVLGLAVLTVLTLLERRLVWGAALAAGAIAWSSFYKPVTKWLFSIGTDSFAEAQHFDSAEAVAFVNSMLLTFRPTLPGSFLAYAVAVPALFVLISRRPKSVPQAMSNLRVLRWVAIAAVVVGFVDVSAKSLSSFRQKSALFAQINDNFAHPVPTVSFANRDIRIIVYIGESTTEMDFGLYGYPRDTTPRLSALAHSDPGLLVFHNVFANMVHTSESLLETLSLGLDASQDAIPIYLRQRLSLPDVLAHNGVATALFSNQGASGTLNYAASIIFQHTPAHFSAATKWAANTELSFSKPYDEQYLYPAAIESFKHLPTAGPSVLFLHSYAGHAHYTDAIPETFRQPVDRMFQADPAMLTGEAGRLSGHVEEYDMAMRYVDYSVGELIDFAHSRGEPTIVVYFPDHGESSWSYLNHDSARFVHEMARIPFVIYFNGAARQVHADLFQKYRALASRSQPSTLAAFAPTLLDLLGATRESLPAWIAAKPVIGDGSAPLPPIVIRDTSGGRTHVSLTEVKPDPAGENANDFATDVYAETHRPAMAGTAGCFQNADTLAKAMRGSLVAPCLQGTLRSAGQGHLVIAGGSGIAAGLDPMLFMKVVRNKALSAWLTVDQKLDGDFCSGILTVVAPPPGSRDVVEFRGDAMQPAPDADACAARLQAAGLTVVADYVPGDAADCPEPAVSGSPLCDAVSAQAKRLAARHGFSGMVADAGSLAGVKRAAWPSSMALLAWNAGVNFNPSRYEVRPRMVVFENDPMNDR